ncbi:hypothetical protein CsSME_00021071 [Camellia sinensis var. sinensis]
MPPSSRRLTTDDQIMPITRQYSDYRPPSNPSGCARSEPYNYFGRKGSMEPEALAVLKTYQLDASKSKIFMVEKYKYMRETLERDWHLRLAELGFNYGDMPTHNLLWRECEKSSHNVAARLAAIPLVQVLDPCS